MRKLALPFIAAAALLGFAASAPQAKALVGVQIGVAPDCPYGYYDVAPYSCAPAGYYGPEWFNDGVFIGAGPWFHGPEHFRGHVDNHFHPDHGYRGPMPARGDHAVAANRVRPETFHGNEMRDGHGHTVR